jgi:hypothetical protein
MTDLNRSTYSGEFGFLIVEPAAGDPGRYDREVILAAHHWEGSWVSMRAACEISDRGWANVWARGRRSRATRAPIPSECVARCPEPTNV